MSLRGHRRGFVAQLPTERYLIVRADSQDFAFAAELVQGLLTLEETGAVGTLTVQDQEYPLLDLFSELGIVQSSDGPETRVILLAKAGVRACIRVDQVHGLVEVERTQILSLPPQFLGDERSWYIGLILFKAGLAIGLSPMWVMERARHGGRELIAQGARQALPFSPSSHSGGKDVVC